MSEPGVFTRLAARIVHASWTVDRAAHALDRLRARVVLALGSDKFLDAYNDIAYARDSTYRATAPQFRRDLFEWERRVIRDFLPPPPARILVGGAGGGRESFALAEMGYRVTAFEPVPALAESIVAMRRDAPIDVFVGRYEDLPVLRPVGGTSPRVDLSSTAPFDAAILGWYSFSHGRSNARRIDTLTRVAALTSGPIVVSYFARPAHVTAPPDQFNVQVGHYREVTADEMREFAERAGLEILQVDAAGTEPAVFKRRGPAGR